MNAVRALGTTAEFFLNCKPACKGCRPAANAPSLARKGIHLDTGDDFPGGKVCLQQVLLIEDLPHLPLLLLGYRATGSQYKDVGRRPGLWHCHR